MSHCSAEGKAFSRLATDWAIGAILYLAKVVRVGGTYNSNGHVRRDYKMVFTKPEVIPCETKLWIRG